MSRAWYQLALASSSSSSSSSSSPSSSSSSSPWLVEAPGHHLGEALALAEKAHPKATIMAARLSPAAPLGDSVGKSPRVVEQGPAAELVAVRFAWPRGVLPEMSALAQLGGAVAGYVAARQHELVTVEAQVEQAQLADVFLGLIERLPVADNVEVRVLHHFEDQVTTEATTEATTEVWLTPRTGVKQVLRFLDDQDRDLLESGYVELAVYLRKERSTLRLTEHKTVLWTSVDLASEARICQALSALGVPSRSKLTTVSSVPHFHTRPEGSRDRVGLIKLLQRQRMRLVDRLDRHGASLSTPKSPTPKRG
jgi:hypothetical protein